MKQQVNGIDSSKSNITEEAKELGRKAFKSAQEKAQSLKVSSEELLEPTLESAKHYARKAKKSSKKAKKYAKENPYKTAFAAVSIFAILTWIFTSRKNR